MKKKIKWITDNINLYHYIISRIITWRTIYPHYIRQRVVSVVINWLELDTLVNKIKKPTWQSRAPQLR